MTGRELTGTENDGSKKIGRKKREKNIERDLLVVQITGAERTEVKCQGSKTGSKIIRIEINVRETSPSSSGRCSLSTPVKTSLQYVFLLCSLIFREVLSPHLI